MDQASLKDHEKKLWFIQKAIKKMTKTIDVANRQNTHSNTDQERMGEIIGAAQRHLELYMAEEQKHLDFLLE